MCKESVKARLKAKKEIMTREMTCIDLDPEMDHKAGITINNIGSHNRREVNDMSSGWGKLQKYGRPRRSRYVTNDQAERIKARLDANNDGRHITTRTNREAQ